MKKCFLWGIFVTVLACVLVLTACSQPTNTSTSNTAKPNTASTVTPSQSSLPPSQTTSKPPVITSTPPSTPSVQANWWDKYGKPTYGGSITISTAVTSAVNSDPTVITSVNNMYPYERLFHYSWTLDRGVFPFNVLYTPPDYYTGELAEKWEQTDPTTITVFIRKGIHWQNIPPTNGREFTADDVVFNFDAILGTGNGFTKPNAVWAATMNLVNRVVAIDKYTVQFKLKQPTYFALDQLMAGAYRVIAPSEVIGQSIGKNWQSMAGTGPWMITDYVANSLVSFDRNPNYWGADERYPEKKLPYADQFKVAVITDSATNLAAIRTGKIDMLKGNTSSIGWQQVQALQKTNPDIQVAYIPGQPTGFYLRVDNKPFTDIRVRKALQLAIDLPTINKGYFGGTATSEANGMLPPLMTGWGTPYNQWTADLQQEYSYNPAKAKQLLAEAGYPNGFNTRVDTSSTSDLGLIQAIKAEFADIGVNMDINSMDGSTLRTWGTAGKNDQIFCDFGMGTINSPITVAGNFTKSYALNFSRVNDPAYEDLYAKLGTATTTTQAQQIFKQMDMYALGQHWILIPPFPTNPMLWQSYLKGYAGEYNATGSVYHPFARLWIDQNLKTSMGR